VADILPKGVLNVIADANDLGGEMTKHPDIRKTSFTGSPATGQKVMASAAGTLKRITLELGGSDASIVLDDVDPKKVAPGIFEGASRTAGRFASLSSDSTSTSQSMTKFARNWSISPRTRWSTTAPSRASSSTRGRTRCSTRR
jgi:hypothetical protein